MTPVHDNATLLALMRTQMTDWKVP